jgi:hypothetical protein
LASLSSKSFSGTCRAATTSNGRASGSTMPMSDALPMGMRRIFTTASDIAAASATGPISGASRIGSGATWRPSIQRWCTHSLWRPVASAQAAMGSQVSSARPSARRPAPGPSSGARCNRRSQRSGASFSTGEKAASMVGREDGADMASKVQRAGA